jgi:hypothetical protein
MGVGFGLNDSLPQTGAKSGVRLIVNQAFADLKPIFPYQTIEIQEKTSEKNSQNHSLMKKNMEPLIRDVQ